MPIGTENLNIQHAINECIYALGKHEKFFVPNGRPLYITLMLAYTVNIIGYAKTILTLNENDKYACIPSICRSLLEMYANLKDYFLHQGVDNMIDIVRLHYICDMSQSVSEFNILKRINKIDCNKYNDAIDSYICTFEKWLLDHFNFRISDGI